MATGRGSRRRDARGGRPGEAGPQSAASSGPADPTEAAPRTDRRVLVALIALGFAARLALALLTSGTQDGRTFYKFAREVEQVGLLRAYGLDAELNHPPIPAYWAWAAYRLTETPDVRAYGDRLAVALAAGHDVNAPLPGYTPEQAAAADRTFAEFLRRFAAVFRLPVVLADALAAWVLYRLWRERAPPAGGPGRAVEVAALFAWSLASVLVTGFHVNTDPIYAALALLAAYLLHRGRPFWGGLALAAAINVKVAPVLLVPALLLGCRSWREAARLVGGLAVGALPFVPVLLAAGPTFYRNALAYASNVERWGLMVPLDPPAGREAMAADHPRHPAYLFHLYARYAVFAAALAWAAAVGFWRRWDRFEAAAVTFALALVLTGGFGVQYLVMPLPLMYAVRPRLATVYGTTAGLFAATVYFVNWTGDDLYLSQVRGLYPWPTPGLGLVAWAVLVWFVVRTVMRPGGAMAAGTAGSAE